MKLFIYVEGQEEELFVNRVLRNYLRPLGVDVQKPILAATSFRIGGEVTVGGVTNYLAVRQDLLNQLKDTDIAPGNILTTLIDLYALPESFPGHRDTIALGISGGAKADFIQQRWKEDIAHSNFHPYIQVHEFEALILTRPSILGDYYPEYASAIELLRTQCAAFPTPEHINETKETSPSHRIISSVPTYQKIDGFRHLQQIGIPELKAHCPRFKEWVERCEVGFG